MTFISRINLWLFLYFFTTFELLYSQEWHEDTGPWVIATKGELWPLPLKKDVQSEYYRLNPFNFKFEISDLITVCDNLENALQRYDRILKKEYEAANKYFVAENSIEVKNVNGNTAEKYLGYLTSLKIRMNNHCESYPYLYMNESYTLSVSNSSPQAHLEAQTIWGVLRGLESFSQLVSPSEKEPGLEIKCQEIVDRPKLPHRGLLIDTGRHYLPVSDILLILDGMSYNKLNVLHWHLVDDNSFPYESQIFPALSKKGAYHQNLVYSANDIERVLEYARMRGIRVLTEFDTPGHTKSWGNAYPQYLTSCYGEDGKPTGKLGPMDPTNEDLYKFLDSFFGEVVTRFPDKYVHLGGDEVLFDCWMSNPNINSFMKKNNFTNNYAKLEELYIQRLLEIIEDLNVKSIVWQEVFDNGVNMKNGTVVHVWTGNWVSELQKITEYGYPALLSACWYLDHISSGGDWIKFYNCDPLSFSTNKSQIDLMIGGEACMWGEFVDSNNVHSVIWPRASAVAERLWSYEADSRKNAEKRLEEHSCRMNKRGIPAKPPNGPGFCIF